MKKRSNKAAPSGSSPLASSRSSDTPETDEEIGRVHRACTIMVCDEGDAMAEFARKLERQRNLLARELEIILRWGSSMWASRPLADKFPGENIAIIEARKVLDSISENID
jgi:hypothetical protein